VPDRRLVYRRSSRGCREVKTADPEPTAAPDILVVLDEAGDDSDERSTAEGLLRSLMKEGNLDAKEAVAFLAARRSQRRQR
jgi:hypothetical protein